MCGLAGIINFSGQPVAGGAVGAMMRQQQHRGPDDSGLFLENNVGLGFVRLSILDLSPAGHQPMASDDGRYVLIFNGEIYNYVELRDELKAHYSFRTRTDTEVLLNAYRHWGADCLARFNGMFAFAIYDRRDQTLFAARDRYGVKPFYYYQSDEWFVFASEITPIFGFIRQQQLPASPDDGALYNYLMHGRTDLDADTFVRQIKKLRHGHCLTIRGGQVRLRRWYNLAEHLHTGWESPEEYRDTLESSVRLRLRSDVPVGICLSGGLDSSSVASTLINGLGQRDFYAFSAVYGAGKRGDESRFIDEYKAQLPNLTYVWPTAQTVADDFEDLMACHFEPFGSPSICSSYTVMKEAARHVKVLMDGQGADEQLGGYAYFFGSFFRGLLAGGHYARLLSEGRAYYRNHRSLSALTYLGFYLVPDRIKAAASFHKAPGVSEAFFRQHTGQSTIHAALYNPKSLHDSLLQHFETKLEHLLKWSDLNSMRFSIELREPFLDHRLVEKTLASPANLLIRNGTTKWILREAMRGRLPEAIRTRQDKVGFENPADEWMRSAVFQQKAHEALHDPALVQSGYFNVPECRKRLKLHQEGRINSARDIWRWIEMARFLNRFSAPVPVSPELTPA